MMMMTTMMMMAASASSLDDSQMQAAQPASQPAATYQLFAPAADAASQEPANVDPLLASVAAVPELPYPGALSMHRTGNQFTGAGVAMVVVGGGLFVGGLATVDGVNSSMGTVYALLGGMALGAGGGVCLAVGVPLSVAAKRRMALNEGYVTSSVEEKKEIMVRARPKKHLWWAAGMGGAGVLLMSSTDSWVAQTAGVGLFASAVPVALFGGKRRDKAVNVSPMAGGAPGATVSMGW